MRLGKYLTEDEVERGMPGLLEDLEARGVEISNNAGALIVDGYLGDIFAAIAKSSAR